MFGVEILDMFEIVTELLHFRGGRNNRFSEILGIKAVEPHQFPGEQYQSIRFPPGSLTRAPVSTRGVCSSPMAAGEVGRREAGWDCLPGGGTSCQVALPSPLEEPGGSATLPGTPGGVLE